MTSITTPLLSNYTNDADTSKYAGIVQCSYGITSANSDRPILFTCQVRNCVTVTLYDKEKKVGMLLHLDATNSVNLSEVIEKIKKNFSKIGSPLKNLEAGVIGGYDTSTSLRRDAEKIATAIKNLTSHVTEKLFVKKQLSKQEESDYETLYDKLIKAAPQDQTQLMAQIDEIFSHSLYSQIALDTRTGKVVFSSKIKYLFFEPKDCNVYSFKAKTADTYLQMLMNKEESVAIMQETSGIKDGIDPVFQNMFIDFALKQRPLKKVYDSTNGKAYL